MRFRMKQPSLWGLNASFILIFVLYGRYPVKNALKTIIILLFLRFCAVVFPRGFIRLFVAFSWENQAF